jgi:hypothetical protein
MIKKVMYKTDNVLVEANSYTQINAKIDHIWQGIKVNSHSILWFDLASFLHK